MGYDDQYDDDEGGNPLTGWLFMGLIVLGLFILYKTTGIIIIPIRR